MNPLGREKTILLYEASVTPANSRAYDGVRRYAAERGWKLKPLAYSLAAEKRSHGKPSRTLAIAEAMDLWRPHGIIVECAGRAPRLPLEAFGKTPVVLLDCYPDVVDRGRICVYTNVESVVRCAARELFPLGMDDFAYMPYTENALWSRRRGERFEDLVVRSGSRFHRLNVPARRIDDVRLVERLVPQMLSLPKPCGVLAANDAVARAVISACEAAKIAVPDEVAVVGVDDDESLCENADISLSSVSIDFMELGRTAARLLDRRMSDRRKRVESQAMVVSEVVRRASTSRLPNVDARVRKMLEFIRRHGAEGVSVAQVVAGLGCSRRLAEMRFRESTGKSVLSALHDRMFESACELLHGGFGVQMVADRLNVSRLTLDRLFSARTGMTAGQWSKSKKSIS